MAIGLGARRRGIAEHSTGAGPIVDDDRLAENSLQRRRDRPRGEIGLPARRKRHDHGDVARRLPGLCPRAPSQSTQDRHG
jgi:hypothetical protein